MRAAAYPLRTSENDEVKIHLTAQSSRECFLFAQKMALPEGSQRWEATKLETKDRRESKALAPFNERDCVHPQRNRNPVRRYSKRGGSSF